MYACVCTVCPWGGVACTHVCVCTVCPWAGVFACTHVCVLCVSGQEFLLVRMCVYCVSLCRCCLYACVHPCMHAAKEQTCSLHIPMSDYPHTFPPQTSTHLLLSLQSRVLLHHTPSAHTHYTPAAPYHNHPHIEHSTP